MAQFGLQETPPSHSQQPWHWNTKTEVSMDWMHTQTQEDHIKYVLVPRVLVTNLLIKITTVHQLWLPLSVYKKGVIKYNLYAQAVLLPKITDCKKETHCRCMQFLFWFHRSPGNPWIKTYSQLHSSQHVHTQSHPECWQALPALMVLHPLIHLHLPLQLHCMHHHFVVGVIQGLHRHIKI